MASTVNQLARQPCLCARWLNQAADCLSGPSDQMLRRGKSVPILTCKYIVISYYIKHNDISTTLAREVSEVQSQERQALALRILWAVSVVLPVMDLIAKLFRMLASIDPAISAMYKQRETKRSLEQQAREIQALGDSIRELVGFMMSIGCKRLRDRAIPAEEVRVHSRTKLQDFVSHFSHKNHLEWVIKKSCEQVLELLEKSCGVKSHVKELAEDDAKESELFSNVGHCIKRLHLACTNSMAADYIKGDDTGPYFKEWTYLAHRRDRIYKICKNRAATYDPSFRLE